MSKRFKVYSPASTVQVAIAALQYLALRCKDDVVEGEEYFDLRVSPETATVTLSNREHGEIQAYLNEDNTAWFVDQGYVAEEVKDAATAGRHLVGMWLADRGYPVRRS